MEKTSSKLYGLHESSVSWINELEFMNDEQKFLEHLLSTHFLDLSAENLYETTRKLIRKLKEVEKPGKLANDLNGYKKKNKLDLPGLSPELVGEWIKK